MTQASPAYAEVSTHYAEEAIDALNTVLERCAGSYGDSATDQVARMFIDLLFVNNLAFYCEVDEVLQLWRDISNRLISEKAFGSEFVIGLYQQYSFYVVPVNYQNPDAQGTRSSQSLLGQRIITALTAAHGFKTPSASGEGLSGILAGSYTSYMQDIPTPEKVTAILDHFPWMAPLYVLSLAKPLRVLSTLNKWTLRKPSADGEGNA